MDPNAQLREHLTDDELAALHDRLDADGTRLAGPAATGATALAGVGTAAADPSPADNDPDVGLPSARTDLWADGVDATTVHAGRYHDAVQSFSFPGGSHATRTAHPDDGNVVSVTLDWGNALGGSSLELEFPPSVAGESFTFHVSATGDNGGPTELTMPDVDRWDGGSDPTGNLDESQHFFEARTYDGGNTWYGKKIGQT